MSPLFAALSVMGEVASNRDARQHEYAVAQLRRSALSELTDALINNRSRAVEEGFHRILAQFDEQARHLMAQQNRFADALMGEAKLRQRAMYDDRIKAIDLELAAIRANAQALYDRMTEVLLLLGGVQTQFASDLANSLTLRLR